MSIIIVSFNSRQYLDKCLTSLQSSRLKSKTEIIVVDNASGDNTLEYNRPRHKNVFYIRNQQNSGFARANNTGIKKSSGKYVLLLNPDTIVPPETLGVMVDFMEQTSSAGVSTCFVQLAKGGIDDACHRGFPTPWNAFCHFSGLSALLPLSLLFNGYHLGYKDLNKIHEIDSCTGAFMLIRRSAGQALKFLDEDFYWYGEDLDFCFRIKKAGLKVFFVPLVGITHFKGVSSGIKKHSRSISSASLSTRIAATNARFDVMKIFYEKHYNYGINRLLSPLVFFAVWLKKQATLTTLKLERFYANRN